MSINLPLKNMTLIEKLAAMESLWDELSRSPEDIQSPEWHKEVLDERRRSVSDGSARFSDWETAKNRIRQKLT